MSVAAIVSHIADAESRLLSQFSQRPKLSALIGVLAGEIQRFEDASIPVQTACLLANAVGVQLDNVGTIIGQARNGQSDDLYRLFLAGKISANSSKGTLETITQLALTLFQADSVSVRGASTPGNGNTRAPMVIGLEIGDPQLSKGYYASALSLIRQSLAAGVEIGWVTTFAGDDAFAFAASTSGSGFASSDGATKGGQLASAYYTNPTI